MSILPAPSATEVERLLIEFVSQMPLVPGRSDASHLDEPPRGRPRILPSLALWAGLLTCVLRGWSSQLALYRLLTLGSFWHYPRLAISDQAVYKRLAQEGTKPLVALFTQLTALLRLERMCPTSPCGPPSQARDSGDPSPSLTLLSSTTLGYENQEWLVYSVRLDV